MIYYKVRKSGDKWIPLGTTYDHKGRDMNVYTISTYRCKECDKVLPRADDFKSCIYCQGLVAKGTPFSADLLWTIECS